MRNENRTIYTGDRHCFKVAKNIIYNICIRILQYSCHKSPLLTIMIISGKYCVSRNFSNVTIPSKVLALRHSSTNLKQRDYNIAPICVRMYYLSLVVYPVSLHCVRMCERMRMNDNFQ